MQTLFNIFLLQLIRCRSVILHANSFNQGSVITILWKSGCDKCIFILDSETIALSLSLSLSLSCILMLITTPVSEVQGLNRNHPVSPSVCPSVCTDSCPAHNFFWFDIGLPHLAHRCIIMRRCVAYIHDQDTFLNFNLKVKFIGFWTCFRARPIPFFWFVWID